MHSHQAQSHLKSIAIRLLAVVGILLILERTYQHLYGSQDVSSNSYSLMRGYENHTLITSKPHNAFSSSQTSRKAIVAAAVRQDDISWIQDFFSSEWESNIYIMNDPNATTTVAVNKGNEASAYLTYLITHYHALPDTMVFLHARRYQWHNEDPMYDHVPTLQNLQISHVQKVGYTSLRCSWNPGCRVGLEPDPEGEDDFFGVRRAYADVYQLFFPGRPVPEEVGHPCCAQFAVSRNKILEKPVRYYEHIRQVLWENELPAGRSGRILEYSWHIIFGQPAVACTNAQKCFCDTFGLCNITCPSEGHCNGRYRLPPFDSRMPEGWPDEGSGQGGWPKKDWWKDEE